MKERVPADFLPLHQNWFHILLSLVGAEQHGYGIMQEVLERTNGAVRIWPATLYGTLQRLIAVADDGQGVLLPSRAIAWQRGRPTGGGIWAGFTRSKDTSDR
jgi:hypothetical protein